MGQKQQLLAVLAKAERQGTMDKALEVLRSYGFVFVSFDTLISWELTDTVMKWDKHHHRYSFMLYEKRAGLNTVRGEYDLDLILAIKLNGKKNQNIHIYEELKYVRTIKKPWKDSQGILWRKVKAGWKFPATMSYDLRKDWRKEQKKLEKNPNLKPSAFYLEWEPLVQKIEKK